MIEHPQLNRLATKASTCEDSLQRALDGLENIPELPEFDYVRKQVDLAHDAIVEVTSCLLAYGERWSGYIMRGKHGR